MATTPDFPAKELLSTDFSQLLRGAALRVTRPRLAVLAAVHTHPHADTDSIVVAVHDEFAEVSRQAVYDSLHTLTAAGLVRRFQPSGSVARYESRVGDNHHHMVCRSCGVITDVDCAVGEAPCLTASDDSGFAIEEAEVTYWGLCPNCSAASRNSTASRSSTAKEFDRQDSLITQHLDHRVHPTPRSRKR